MPDEWVDLLRDALNDEFGDTRPHVCTLATVEEDGTPAARTVVCRRVDRWGKLYIASDARSDKNAQVRGAGAAAVFWLPTRREQFRLTGTAQILDSLNNPPERAKLWESLTPSARALFDWPSPGQPRVADESAFLREAAVGLGPPPTFEVIVLSPHTVEHLDLKPHPHERTRWTSEKGRQRLNP